MKSLSEKEFYDAPKSIQFIYAMAMIGGYVLASVYNKALKEHPEYFEGQEQSLS